MSLKEKIIKLHNQGLKYRQIQKELDCSMGTIAYHLNSTSKAKTRQRSIKFKTNNPLKIRLSRFNNAKNHISIQNKILTKQRKILLRKLNKFYKRGNMSDKITLEQFMEKHKNGFFCYLTGKPININDGQSYEFDHIIPKSQGGHNTLDNLGLCLTEVNKAKYDKTPEEFFQICKDVLLYNGYQVTKNAS